MTVAWCHIPLPKLSTTVKHNIDLKGGNPFQATSTSVLVLVTLQQLLLLLYATSTIMPSPDPSADTSSCAANTITAYFVSAICFGVLVAGFGKGLSANPALVKIIEKNVEARDQGGG